MINFWKLFRSPTNGENAIIIMGLPRSGTSILASLVKECGVYLGEKDWMRPADSRNPKGFYELVEINKIDDRLISESGYKSHLLAEKELSLRAVKRVARAYTLYRMVRLLGKLSKSSKWGFKAFPTTFYWWRPFIPKAKIIAIWREPIENSVSIQRTFKRFTYTQCLDWWVRANAELLYHLSNSNSLLVKLENLLDPRLQVSELTRIADFCGGDVDMLVGIMLSYTNDGVSYPKLDSVGLNEEGRRIYEALTKHST